MHIFHKWQTRWDKPVLKTALVRQGFLEKLVQRNECKICGVVKYRVVSTVIYDEE